MARLLLATPEGQQVVELRAQNSLGRHPSNSIQLLDKIVSKEHCTIEQRGAEFVLRDLGSLNGTYVNGERVVGERALAHGDDIALGTTRARFDDGTGRPLAPPARHRPRTECRRLGKRSMPRRGPACPRKRACRNPSAALRPLKLSGGPRQLGNSGRRPCR
jgi:hypothetical protein